MQLSERWLLFWMVFLALGFGIALFLPRALAGAVLVLDLWGWLALAIVGREQLR